MKALIFIVLLAHYGSAQIQTDKVAHFGVGYATSATLTAVSYKQRPGVRLLIGSGTGLILGLGKEIRDYRSYGVFNSRDLAYTFIGGVVGSLTVSIPISKLSK